MHIHSEKYFPCDPAPAHDALRSFVRLNVTNPEEVADFLRLDKSTAIVPILCVPSPTTSNRSRDHYFYDTLIGHHVSAAMALKKQGYETLALSVDDDGALQQALSPRFFSAPLEERMVPVLKAFSALNAIIDDLWVALTLEELAPGGLDATDGVLILQKLGSLGLKQVIIAAGTRDFMPLFERRTTQKKASESPEFFSHEPDLASAIWALSHTNLKVWALAAIHDPGQAIAVATHMGLAGLLKRALLCS